MRPRGLPNISAARVMMALQREYDVVGKTFPDTLHASGQTPELLQAATGEVTVQAAGGEGDQLPTFEMQAYSGGLLYPKGYPMPAVVDLTGVHQVPAPISLLNHDNNQRVGHLTQVTVTKGNKGGITARGVISGDGAAAREVIAEAKRGFPWKCSIGVRPDPNFTRIIRDGETVRVNDRTFRGPVCVHGRTMLQEISFVPVAGEDQSFARVAAAGGQEVFPMPPFEQWLLAQGFTLTDLNDTQRTSMQSQYDRLVAAGNSDPANHTLPNNNGGAGTGGNSAENHNGQLPTDLTAIGDQAAEAVRTSTAAELQRQHGITQLCAQHGNPTFRVNGQDIPLQLHAISENWDLTRTELEAVRESRGRAPAAHSFSRSDARANLDVLACGLLLQCAGASGMTIESPRLRAHAAIQFGLPGWLTGDMNAEGFQRTVSDARRLGPMSLMDLGRACLVAEGQQFLWNPNDIMQAAFASNSFANVITTSINAQVLDSFEEFEDTSERWTKSNPTIKDFLTQERVRLKAGGDTLEPVGEGGTANLAAYSDRGESYKVFRFGKQWLIDEITMRNDNLDVINDIPRTAGMGAKRLRPDLVYATLMANPAMSDTVALFHSTHGNLSTSTSFSETNVKTVVQKFMKRTENGVILQVKPNYLLIPPSLHFAARQLNNSSETRAASANGGPTSNELRGQWDDIIPEPRLELGCTHPLSGQAQVGSATTWYVGDRNRRSIEVGTIRGMNGRPLVRRFTLDRGQWGIGFDVAHAIGVGVNEYLPMEKCTA